MTQNEFDAKLKELIATAQSRGLDDNLIVFSLDNQSGILADRLVREDALGKQIGFVTRGGSWVSGIPED